MAKFPLKYEVKTEANAKIDQSWTCTANSQIKLNCAIPPEFNGPGHALTPEDLFALAALNCIIAAFKAECAKQKENFDLVKGKASLGMDFNRSENKLFFTELDISIDVTGASNKENVKKVLEKALGSCPVCGAIKTSKTFHLNVS